MENPEQITEEPAFSHAKKQAEKYIRSRDIESLKTQLNDWESNIKFKDVEIKRYQDDLIEMKKLYDRDFKHANEQIEIHKKDKQTFLKIIDLIKSYMKPLEEQQKIKALEEQKKKAAEMKTAKVPLTNKKTSLKKEED